MIFLTTLRNTDNDMILTTAEQSNYKLLTIVEIYNYKYAEKQLV